MSRARCRNTGCPTVFRPPCALMQKAASTGPKKQDTRCFYEEIHEIILKSLHGGGRIFLCLCPAVPTPFQVPFVVFGIAKRDARISVGGFYRAHSCGQRCRIVRLGDSRERKKRPHLVKKLNHKSIKEGIQMKQNRIFDQNSSQKARSWHYNMDTNRAEAQFADGSAIAIDCLAIEDEYGNTPAQRAELDWLLYNKPLECVQLVLSGEIEHYLSLGCDHGKLKD